MLRRVERIILSVPALPGAVKYYRDVLKLTLRRQDARSAVFVMADGQTEIVLRADADQPTEEIQYLVADVQTLYENREQLRLKFIQPPRRSDAGFIAAVKDPFGNVLQIMDRRGEEKSAGDAAPAAALFPGVETTVPTRQRALIDIYQQIGRTADDLPYTPDFERLHDVYSKQLPAPHPTRREVWRHLLNLRKAGKLPKLGEARSPSPKVSEEDEQLLRTLLGADIGKRDRLPYTERFDSIVDRFNAGRPRPLSPHLVWRLAAKLAK